MKNSWIKWTFAAVVLFIVGLYGFTFIVNEGDSAVITRFGASRKVTSQAGIYLKLPWPFEKIHTFDARKHYMDTGYVETLTKDKKNIILQTYVVWGIDDPLTFFKRLGSKALAEKYIGDMVTNVKNGVMGNYELSALVSTDIEQLKINEIEHTLLNDVNKQTSLQYGITVYKVGIKRLGLPEANVQSVFEQMKSERQQFIDQLIAEGERDANIIINETDVEVARITSDGRQQASQIRAETEQQVAEIYAEAHRQDPEFYEFLRKLTSLEKTMDENTTVILRIDQPPFDVLREDGMENNSNGE